MFFAVRVKTYSKFVGWLAMKYKKTGGLSIWTIQKDVSCAAVFFFFHLFFASVIENCVIFKHKFDTIKFKTHLLVNEKKNFTSNLTLYSVHYEIYMTMCHISIARHI